jgi:hypothetical protein
MHKLVISIIILISLTTISISTVTDHRYQGYSLNNDEDSPLPGGTYGDYIVQWERSYGRLPVWSARYEGPQPVGDADNDGKNELLIGGRDPFMRVMKWNPQHQTYYEQQKIIDPMPGIGYTLLGLGSATGFSIEDVDNDGYNDVAVAWGRHFSFFTWDGSSYQKRDAFVITNNSGWETTLDCFVGDCDNDGLNEVVVTGSYSDQESPEVVVLQWDGNKLMQESFWNAPGRKSVYFPWIADVDNDGNNEIICNTNETVVLDWQPNLKTWKSTIVARYTEESGYPFGAVSKDSNGDGKPEIHVTFYTPEVIIFEWDGSGYKQIFHQSWPGEEATIEAIDIGDVDGDGFAEVCIGTNYVHILQWNGMTYEEEAVITLTHGLLAVTCVGDFDNDGLLEINAGAVGISSLQQQYKSWIIKYQS